MKNIPLNDLHEKLGAKMAPFAGFNMPVRYSSDIEEHKTVREAVGVFDVSHMGEFYVKGERALDFLQYITTNDVSKLYNGKIQYSTFPNENGGLVDDLLVYKFSDTEYYLVVNAGNIDKDWEWVNKHNTFGVELTNLSDNYSLFALQGRKAKDVLAKLTSLPVKEMEYYTFTNGTVAGLEHVIVSATGYTGAGGFELYVENKDAVALWNALFEAGAEFGIKPIGLGARDTLRLEMGYSLYGNDLSDTTSPLEAGLGWVTKLDKNFIGVDILRAQKEKGLERKIVAFEMIDRGVPRAHYKIHSTNGEEIGEVTSGTQSPTLGKGIGLAYVKAEFAKPGLELQINIREKLLKIETVKLPFVKSTV